MKFIVRPAFDHYGLNEPDNESHLQLKHRALVAYFACKFNYDRCTQVAQMKGKSRSRFLMDGGKCSTVSPLERIDGK